MREGRYDQFAGVLETDEAPVEQVDDNGRNDSREEVEIQMDSKGVTLAAAYCYSAQSEVGNWLLKAWAVVINR